MEKTFPVRLVLLGLALLIALGVAALQTVQSGGLTALPLRDYVEYWAAGQLLVQGQNPYDPVLVAELEAQAGREEEAILMWNPPWTLPFVLPLGWMSARTGHLAWLIFQFLTLILCAELLWRHFGGSADSRIAAHLMSWTFLPSAAAVAIGQITPLLLLGAVGFLSLVRSRRDLAAGAACALLAIKPHLVYLFWPAILIWSIRQRRWGVLVGGILTGLLLVGVALAFRSSVLADYWYTLLNKPPQQYRSPTLGTLLRMWLGDPGFSWQFVSLVPGLVWFAWYYRGQADWDETFSPLLFVSVLTASYGAWLFDLVILLVPILAVAATVLTRPGWQRWAALAVHVAVNALALWLVLGETEYLVFIWIPPVLALAYLGLQRSYATCAAMPLPTARGLPSPGLAVR